MIDYKKIAIADVIRHPISGIISHQPDITEPISEIIRARDSRANLLWVLCSECFDDVTEDERKQYWKEFNAKKT